MKYIDFHVHAFTDTLAERAISHLEEVSGMSALTRGYLQETLDLERSWKVSQFVLLPVATKPSQVGVINHWVAEAMQQHPEIIGFGALHPDDPNIEQAIEEILQLGLKGVKLHPDYQGFFIDEPRMFPIYRKCAQAGLPILFHAGRDPLCPQIPHATPQAALRVFWEVPKLTMILAHLGGTGLWEEVERVLAGTPGNLYLDTAFLHGNFPAPCEDALLKRIIQKHGADRILLASDCPWDDIPTGVAQLERLGLRETELENICYRNAERLLHLS